MPPAFALATTFWAHLTTGISILTFGKINAYMCVASPVPILHFAIQTESSYALFSIDLEAMNYLNCALQV